MRRDCEARITIEAPVEDVWNVISDVTRVGEWSGECRRCEWVGDSAKLARSAISRGQSSWLDALGTTERSRCRRRPERVGVAHSLRRDPQGFDGMAPESPFDTGWHGAHSVVPDPSALSSDGGLPRTGSAGSSRSVQRPCGRPGPPEDRGRSWRSVIATIDVADLGRRSLIQAVRGRPAPGEVPGLRWLDIAPAAALASYRPPGLRRAVLLAMWDDEHSAQVFSETHQLAERFAGDGFHAVLRPLRAFGSWPGLPSDISRSRVTHHDGPVIVTTLGRLRISQALRFLRASRPAERAAVNSDGFLWGAAAPRPPFVATVSVWSSEDSRGRLRVHRPGRRAPASHHATTPEGLPPRVRLRSLRSDFEHGNAAGRRRGSSSRLSTVSEI